MPGPNTNKVERPTAKTLQPKDRTRPLIYVWDGYINKNYRFAPYNPDALIQSKGYDELDNMLSTAAFVAPFTVLCNAVLYKPWRIKPAAIDKKSPRYEEARKAAKQFEWHLRNITDVGDVAQDPRQISYQILDACRIGFSLHEIEWRYVEEGPAELGVRGQFGFQRFSFKNPKGVGFDLDPINNALRNIVSRPLAVQDALHLDIPVEKCLLYTYRPEKDLPYGRGLARACYKHVWILDTIEKAHAIAMEKFATPGFIAKVPGGDKAYMDEIREALDAYRLGASLAIPDDVTTELNQVAASNYETFNNAKRWHAEQIAQVILSQQLTTNQGVGQGSYALGEVHQRTQEYQLSAIRTDLEWLWTRQVAHRWTRYNLGPENLDLCPRFDLGVWDAGERKMIAEFFKTMIDMGSMHPQEEDVREQTGIGPIEDEYRSKLEGKEAAELEAMKNPQPTAGAAPKKPSGGNK